ncbi:MAG: ATP-binding protein [Fidelibacterota bacterium]|nr:MAG: ATP-binding protein [Candidatus Neomarinimicrobiota bacterium]
MEDLSLHIMDIVENSLRAGAQCVEIKLFEDHKENTLSLEIEDDGQGMNADTLKGASDPFYTTKEGKRFGLGLPLLAQACEETGGSMIVENREPTGIRILATFHSDNIDMKPVGDIKETMRVLMASHPEVTFSYEYSAEDGGSA